MAKRKCLVRGCKKPYYCKGWCESHYRRNERYGDPEGGREIFPKDAQCKVLGCSVIRSKRGYCEKHYRHFLKYGDPLVGSFNAPAGSGYTTVDGYRRLYMPNHPNASVAGDVAEHTVVMSKIIGRPLNKGESVHHKNGIRTDNRESNLELWRSKRQQPKGQRVEDLVVWAREILQQYGELFPEGGK